jgi:FkbM family methyltransferase
VYSQYEEEKYILESVGERTGTFLDIGAWHASQFSNTRRLFEIGWTGVLIEPSPEPFLGLLKEYGNDPMVSLICAAVGFEKCAVKMHATADAVSTSSEAVYRQWKNAGGYYGSFWAPQITIEDILNQFGGFDFVNFDAEGISADLFIHYLRTGQRPRCMSVEHDDRLVEISQQAQKCGYKAIYTNGTNVVFGQ